MELEKRSFLRFLKCVFNGKWNKENWTQFSHNEVAKYNEDSFELNPRLPWNLKACLLIGLREAKPTNSRL